jgi:hypothetical protein
MCHHENRTGMKFEPVMVCPQEEYSLQAIRSFACDGGFLAVANSRCIARDSGELVLRGADLLSAAQDRYFGVSILKRYYPSDRALLALGQFLGKPAILVTHHDFFREGLAKLEELVSWVTGLPGVGRWNSIGGVATTTCIKRRIGANEFELKIFSDKFEMDHAGSGPAVFHVTRRVPAEADVTSVLVNDVPATFLRRSDAIAFKFEVVGDSHTRVELRRARLRQEGQYPSTIRYQAGVAARRFLSELRDRFQVLGRRSTTS